MNVSLRLGLSHAERYEGEISVDSFGAIAQQGRGYLMRSAKELRRISLSMGSKTEKCSVSHSVDFGAGIWLAGCDTGVGIQSFVGLYPQQPAGDPDDGGTAHPGSRKVITTTSLLSSTNHGDPCRVLLLEASERHMPVGKSLRYFQGVTP